MRTSPAIDVVLTRFGVWRAAMALLAAAALAAIWAWWAAWDLAQPPDTRIALLAALVIASGMVVALAASLGRVQTTALHWDGQGWSLRRPQRDRTAAAEPVAGEIVVAIDLGLWMLLRFEPALRVGRVRCVWLPVQRRGIETQWHALRCAVYSPRPTPTAEPARP
jgi:hypothetical protein